MIATNYKIVPALLCDHIQKPTNLAKNNSSYQRGQVVKEKPSKVLGHHEAQEQLQCTLTNSTSILEHPDIPFIWCFDDGSGEHCLQNLIKTKTNDWHNFHTQTFQWALHWRVLSFLKRPLPSRLKCFIITKTYHIAHWSSHSHEAQLYFCFSLCWILH